MIKLSYEFFGWQPNIFYGGFVSGYSGQVLYNFQTIPQLSRQLKIAGFLNFTIKP